MMFFFFCCCCCCCFCFLFFVSKLKLYYLWKMHGYPQLSFWIPRAVVKFCFLRIVLNRAKYPCISRHHPLETRVSREAQNVCAVTKVGTVLNSHSSLFFRQYFFYEGCGLLSNRIVMCWTSFAMRMYHFSSNLRKCLLFYRRRTRNRQRFRLLLRKFEYHE